MTLHQNRLERLEKLRRDRANAQVLSDINARCADGTASLAEMAVFLGDEPHRVLREEMAHRVPAVLELKEAGTPPYGVLTALVYPPGEELPEIVRDQIHFLEFQVTCTPEERRGFTGHTKNLERWLGPDHRLSAAAILISLGALDAGPAREAFWTFTDEGWVLSPWVLDAERARRSGE